MKFQIDFKNLSYRLNIIFDIKNISLLWFLCLYNLQSKVFLNKVLTSFHFNLYLYISYYRPLN